MSKPNPLALYQSVEYLKAENAELKEALKIAADALAFNNNCLQYGYTADEYELAKIKADSALEEIWAFLNG